MLAPPPCAPSVTVRRALVPAAHASDLGTKKGLKKFKEGQKVSGKVLAVDAGAPGRGAGRGRHWEVGCGS